MEKIGKVFFALLAFLAGLTIWNTYAINLITQVLFIITFLIAPFIWGLEKKKIAVGENSSRQKSIIGEFFQKNISFLPYYFIFLLIISKFIFAYFGKTDYEKVFELLFYTYMMGILLHLVIRNTDNN
jgi:hypothetical protein